MPRAVDVCVVTVFRFVFNVSRIDGNAAGLFFGSRVNLIICLGFAAELRSENRADGSRQRGLAVVNVTDGAHVHMGLGTFKLTLCHESLVPVMRIERMTSPLPRECSTTEPHGHAWETWSG